MLYAMTILSFLYLWNLFGIFQSKSIFHINFGILLCGIQFALFAQYLGEIFLISSEPLVTLNYNHGDILLPFVYLWFLSNKTSHIWYHLRKNPEQIFVDFQGFYIAFPVVAFIRSKTKPQKNEQWKRKKVPLFFVDQMECVVFSGGFSNCFVVLYLETSK